VILLLDTNVVSALMHRLSPALSRLQKEDPHEVVLCSPVAAEIHYGLSRLPEGSNRRRLLTAEYTRLRQAVGWADWTEAAATEFGRQKAILEEHGTPIEDMDIAIGSIALALGARLATLNVRHLRRLAGLTLDDWTTGE
jgi:tRNA(fMet)-specific endonuclease VapC